MVAQEMGMEDRKGKVQEVLLINLTGELAKRGIDLTGDQLQMVTEAAARNMKSPEWKQALNSARGASLFVLAKNAPTLSDMRPAGEYLKSLPLPAQREAMEAFERIARAGNPTGKEADNLITFRLSQLGTQALKPGLTSDLKKQVMDAVHSEANTRGYAAASDYLNGYLKPLPAAVATKTAAPEYDMKSITFRTPDGKEFTVSGVPGRLQEVLAANAGKSFGMDDKIAQWIERGELSVALQPGKGGLSVFRDDVPSLIIDPEVTVARINRKQASI